MDQSLPKVLVIHPRYPEAGLKLLQSKCTVTVCEGTEREEILSKVKGVDGILWANCESLDMEILQKAGPQLKAIAANTAGFDHVDLDEIKKRGIKFGYAPYVSSDAVADLAIGLMISAARRFNEGFSKIVNNCWKLNDPHWMLGQDIKGSTVGIVGFGAIGQVIAKRLKGFEVKQILYAGNKEKFEGQQAIKAIILNNLHQNSFYHQIGKQLDAILVSLDDLLKQSDYVFAACPLTNQTKNLFDKVAFAKMKPTSVFINIARGGVVVQNDLIDALQNGTIFAAGLDVMDPEPLPADHLLTKISNCILMPHLGSATSQTRNNMALLSAQSLLNGLEGKPMIYPA